MQRKRIAIFAGKLFRCKCGILAVLGALFFSLISFTTTAFSAPQPDSKNVANISSHPSNGWRLVSSENNQKSYKVAVIYPDIGEPYRSIFTNIIGGIEDALQSRVLGYAINKGIDTKSLEDDLRRYRIGVIVALGRNGLKVASTLDSDSRIVAGGVIWAPQKNTEAISVVSLAPDPDLLFSQLTKMAPSIGRVFVVYNSRQNQWLLDIAKRSAASRNIELVAFDANDIKSAFGYYKEILDDIDPKHDALWLPQDSTTVNDAAILAFILEQAWKKSIALFSSSVVHVKRGALFSLYPNNKELGKQLGSIALNILKKPNITKGVVFPLKSVLTAVNVRTASHLGLALSYRDQQDFDLVFPQP